MVCTQLYQVVWSQSCLLRKFFWESDKEVYFSFVLGTKSGTFEMVIRIFDDDDGHLEVDQLSGLLAAKPRPPSM